VTSSIGVAIVSYNTASLLRRCLRSVLEDTRGPVLVVDNQSTDGSAELVRREFPGVLVKAETENHGFGAGANLALRELQTPYVLLLNADTELTPPTVDPLAAYLDEHPRAAIVGPRIVNAAGRYERSAHHFPTPTSLLLHARWWPGPQSERPSSASERPVISRRSLGAIAGRSEWHARSADWVLGAALAIRREAFTQVDGFDEAYFLYQEEIDLCYRMRQAGWEIHYAPVATIIHVGGASTAQHATDSFGQFVRSTQRFARLRYSRPKAAGIRAVLGTVLVTRLVLEAARLGAARDPERRERIRGRIAAWRRGLVELRNGGSSLRKRS
jgi:N-acetylglucosaminyl-diphospho-decaprenol L-rhamnosyltransferase